MTLKCGKTPPPLQLQYFLIYPWGVNLKVPQSLQLHNTRQALENLILKEWDARGRNASVLERCRMVQRVIDGLDG